MPQQHGSTAWEEHGSVLCMDLVMHAPQPTQPNLTPPYGCHNSMVTAYRIMDILFDVCPPLDVLKGGSFVWWSNRTLDII